MAGTNRPEDEKLKDEKPILSPPGMGDNIPGTATVNGHVFRFRRRTFGDMSRIRAYALNMLALHTTPELAVELVSRRGTEYKIAELGICLEDAPAHWKVFSQAHGREIIAPEVLDFDEYSDEFLEVYQEYSKFLNTFRKPKQ
jgi:hypothetical protein